MFNVVTDGLIVVWMLLCYPLVYNDIHSNKQSHSVTIVLYNCYRMELFISIYIIVYQSPFECAAAYLIHFIEI